MCKAATACTVASSSQGMLCCLRTLLKLHLNSCCYTHLLGVSQQKPLWMTQTCFSLEDTSQNAPHPRNVAQRISREILRECLSSWLNISVIRCSPDEPISRYRTAFQVNITPDSTPDGIGSLMLQGTIQGALLCCSPSHPFLGLQPGKQGCGWITPNLQIFYLFIYFYSNLVRRKGVLCRACVSPVQQSDTMSGRPPAARIGGEDSLQPPTLWR